MLTQEPASGLSLLQARVRPEALTLTLGQSGVTGRSGIIKLCRVTRSPPFEAGEQR
jgi:hypothetical protein